MYPAEMLGPVEPKHFRAQAWELLDGAPVLPALAFLEKAVGRHGGSSEKGREAAAIIRGVKAWVEAKSRRIRDRAARAPAAALAEARRFSRRIRDLEQDADLHAFVKRLEADRDVADLGAVLDELDALRKARARGAAKATTTPNPKQLATRARGILSRKALSPALRAEAGAVLKAIETAP
jgi:hypothetical protein